MRTLRTFLIFATSAILALPVAAQDTGPLTAVQFDTRAPNGLLDSGERNAFRNALVRRSASGNSPELTAQILEIRELEQELGTDALIPISRFTRKPAEAFLGTCDSDQAVYIRETVMTHPQTVCRALAAAPGGAKISFDRDGAADTKTLTFKGALAIPLARGLLGGSTRGMAAGDPFRLSQAPLSFFVEADGKSASGADNSGYVRTGFKSDLIFAGGGLDELAIVTALYYQSDVGLGGSGYGIKTTIIPAKRDWSIGGPLKDRSRAGRKPVYWYFSPKFALDAMHISEPGDTGFTADEDYLWATATVGLNYVNKNVGQFGMSAGLEVSHSVDLAGDSEATFGSATASFYLDEKEKTAMSFTYEKGTQYMSLTDIESFNLGLSFAF